MERAGHDQALAGATIAPADDVLVASLEGPPDVRTPMGEPGYNLSEAAEIFSPSQSGMLAHIDFQMGESSGAGTPPARVSVRAAPGEWPGAVIAQTSIPYGSIPGLGQQPPPWARVSFHGDVPLTAGTYYAIVITPLQPESDFTVYGTMGYTALPTYQAPIDSGNWEERDKAFFTFRVYVR